MSNFYQRRNSNEATSSSSNGNDVRKHDASLSPFVGERCVTTSSTDVNSPRSNHPNNHIIDRTQIRAALNDALGCHRNEDDSFHVNWETVHGLLLQLGPSLSANQPQKQCSNALFVSTEEDPFGRTFISRLLSRDPPMNCVDAALLAFPDSVAPNNPVAFFSACSNASLRVIARLMHHVVERTQSSSEEDCPYPWILSQFISVEATQVMLQVYPEGIWETSKGSAFLSSDRQKFNLLDYILFSPSMIERRDFDETTWQKFKLILVSADGSCNNGCEISPVHTVLDRILATPGCLEDVNCAQHILWFLHELRSSDEWIFQKQRPRQSSEGLFPLHLLLSHTCITSSQQAMVAARELCKIIIEADSLAVMHGISKEESLYPLHMAIENGWPCHDLLLAAWPESIEIPDPRTGLLPFQAASSSTTMQMSDNESVAQDKTGDLSLDITFELLRANPMSCAASSTIVGSTMMMEVDSGNATVSGMA